MRIRSIEVRVVYRIWLAELADANVRTQKLRAPWCTNNTSMRAVYDVNIEFVFYICTGAVTAVDGGSQGRQAISQSATLFGRHVYLCVEMILTLAPGRL